MAREGRRGADLVDGILEREEWHLSALLILKNSALIVAASLTTILAIGYAPQWGTVAAICALTLLVLASMTRPSESNSSTMTINVLDVLRTINQPWES